MRARSIRVAVGVGVFVLMGEKAIEEAEENDCSSKIAAFFLGAKENARVWVVRSYKVYLAASIGACGNGDVCPPPAKPASSSCPFAQTSACFPTAFAASSTMTKGTMRNVNESKASSEKFTATFFNLKENKHRHGTARPGEVVAGGLPLGERLDGNGPVQRW